MKKLFTLVLALMAMAATAAVTEMGNRNVEFTGLFMVYDDNNPDVNNPYDLNADGAVNVGDVTELVGVVLGGGGGSALGGAQTIKVGNVEFTMLPVSGGTFQMGSPSSDTDAWDDETPQHSVTLSDFYMGETEVTQALWLEVMGSNPSSFTGDLQLPVERVSWYYCQEFIAKLNEKTGKTFRLPTEAEWEYAARGGNKSQGYMYAGSNDIDKVAWYEDNSSYTTHPVKQKQANELGLYDMTGNVWEWCSDWSGDYGSSAQTNPAGPSTGDERVLRGGGWGSDVRICRVAARNWDTPSESYLDLGLRLVMDMAPEFAQSKYDVNGDGVVNVGDVTELVGVVLGGGGGSALGGAQTIKVGNVEFTMLPVSGGTFQMGSPDSDTEAWDDEKPQHSVTLSDYYMGETEVTQALWLEVMGSNPSKCQGHLRRPVERVSWNDCQEFITKLNAKTGKTFRLPTEAEWEYAARGGSKSQGYKYAGSDDLDKVGWYRENSSSITHPVKGKQANELGLYDMSGNVWEWCSDWSGDYSSSSQTNPAGPSTGSDRVCRGGGWSSNARYCRVATRNWFTPSQRDYYLGLRLVLLVP